MPIRRCVEIERNLRPQRPQVMRKAAHARKGGDKARVCGGFRDIGASIASGSFPVDGMLVAPCSVKTLSAIAHCGTDELVARAADVQLKERRRVVLLFRETPLHAGHIAIMERATLNGAIVMPPVPAFYHRPSTIDDIVTQTVGRALDLFGIDAKAVRRWNGAGTDPA